jgi:hypothetical protein
MKIKRFLVVSISAIALIIVLSVIYSEQIFANNSIHSDDHHTDYQNNFLLTKNREELVVCVESFQKGQVSDQTLLNKTEKLIEKNVKKHEEWGQNGLDQFSLKLKVGCSFDPILLQDGKNHVFYKHDKESARITEKPSEERLGIFVVDEKTMREQFDNKPTTWAPEEFACEAKDCFEVTTGIYVSVSQFNSGRFLEELKHGFGIDFPIPGVEEID